MHLYVVARAPLDRLKRWENDIASKAFPYLWNADCRFPPQWGMYQVGIRPIQLYEIVFPRESLNDVLGMIQPYGGYGINPKVISLLRLGLNLVGPKLKEIPIVPPDVLTVSNGKILQAKNFLFRDGVDVMGLGLMDDEEREFPTKVENL